MDNDRLPPCSMATERSNMNHAGANMYSLSEACYYLHRFRRNYFRPECTVMAVTYPSVRAGHRFLADLGTFSAWKLLQGGNFDIDIERHRLLLIMSFTGRTTRD